MMIILEAPAGVQAKQSIRVGVMGKQTPIRGVALFQYGVLVIVVVHIAALTVSVADAEAVSVIVVLAEDDSSAGGASSGLDELVESVFLLDVAWFYLWIAAFTGQWIMPLEAPYLYAKTIVRDLKYKMGRAKRIPAIFNIQYTIYNFTNRQLSPSKAPTIE